MGDLVGFRFHPPDKEIINLLSEKRLDLDFSVQKTNKVDTYNFQPFELHCLSAIELEELVQCYFFCAPYCKYPKGKPANRRTKMGYWKLTGKGCKTFAEHRSDMIGCKNFLVFCAHCDTFRNHNAKKFMHGFYFTYNRLPKVEPQRLPSHYLPLDSRNHVAEKTVQEVEFEQVLARNHVAENIFATHKLQLLQSHHLPYSRNHVAENISVE